MQSSPKREVGRPIYTNERLDRKNISTDAGANLIQRQTDGRLANNQLWLDDAS